MIVVLRDRGDCQADVGGHWYRHHTNAELVDSERTIEANAVTGGGPQGICRGQNLIRAP